MALVHEKKISAWDEHFATDEERAIAKRINKEVGYEGTLSQAMYCKTAVM